MSFVGFVWETGNNTGLQLEVTISVTCLKRRRKTLSSKPKRKNVRKLNMNFKDICFTSSDLTTMTRQNDKQ
jgi:hypothetical protein